MKIPDRRVSNWDSQCPAKVSSWSADQIGLLGLDLPLAVSRNPMISGGLRGNAEQPSRSVRRGDSAHAFFRFSEDLRGGRDRRWRNLASPRRNTWPPGAECPAR